MIDAVVGFAALLRSHGIGVGADRTLLASRAIRLVDVADPVAVRRALRLTLLLSGNDEERFGQLFDEWFTADPFEAQLSASRDSVDADTDGVENDAVGDPDPLVELHATSVAEAYIDDPSEQVSVSSDDPDAERQRGGGELLGGDDGEVRPRFDPADSVGDLDGSDLDRAAEAAERIDDDDEARSVELAVGGSSAVDDLDALRRVLAHARDEHRARLARHERPAPSLRSTSVLANPFTRDEQRVLDATVRVMWPQLVGAPAWRRRPSRSGEFDLRHTLRSSVTLGGVPAVVRRRGPATTRPDLVVLVDTSVSMRPSARLMLHLVHALRRRPGRVRVLAFVDECVDVTDVVRHADLAMALGTLLDDAPGGVLDPARSSDYGTALASLWHRYARVLRPSTTVLILGDGRSNGRAPGFDLVADLTARCRRTVWCSPEPEGAWGFGNGEMAAYAERVDAAISVRSLDQLAGAIELGVFARHPVGPGRRGDGPRPDWVATAG